MMGWLAHHYSHTKDHQNKTPGPLSTNKERDILINLQKWIEIVKTISNKTSSQLDDSKYGLNLLYKS